MGKENSERLSNFGTVTASEWGPDPRPGLFGCFHAQAAPEAPAPRLASDVGNSNTFALTTTTLGPVGHRRRVRSGIQDQQLLGGSRAALYSRTRRQGGICIHTGQGEDPVLLFIFFPSFPIFTIINLSPSLILSHSTI